MLQYSLKIQRFSPKEIFPLLDVFSLMARIIQPPSPEPRSSWTRSSLKRESRDELRRFCTRLRNSLSYPIRKLSIPIANNKQWRNSTPSSYAYARCVYTCSCRREKPPPPMIGHHLWQLPGGIAQVGLELCLNPPKLITAGQWKENKHRIDLIFPSLCFLLRAACFLSAYEELDTLCCCFYSYSNPAA